MEKIFRNITLVLLLTSVVVHSVFTQCLATVDTICVTVPDTLFLNDQSEFSSYNWTTNNGATLTIAPGDTMVFVDWSTSSILNGLDSVCVVGVVDATCSDTICIATYIKDCSEICDNGIDDNGDGQVDEGCCEVNVFHQGLKKPGEATLCEILLANTSLPLATADCDGGGIDNLTECQNGGNPGDPNDDVTVPTCTSTSAEICAYVLSNITSAIATQDCDNGGVDNLTECQLGYDPTDVSDDSSIPATCTSGTDYYLGFDNHAVISQQTSGNPISGTFPIGIVGFEDCMLPQPTPATLTSSGQPFCIGGIKEANLITSTNWNVVTICSQVGMTQRNDDNPTACEVVIDKGLPTEQVFTISEPLISAGGSLTATSVKDGLKAANILPACMVMTGGTVAGIATDEAACVDFNGANWQYTVACDCKLPNGDIPNSITVKVCQDSGDYANYLLKIL